MRSALTTGLIAVGILALVLVAAWAAAYVVISRWWTGRHI